MELLVAVKAASQRWKIILIAAMILMLIKTRFDNQTLTKQIALLQTTTNAKQSEATHVITHER